MASTRGTAVRGLVRQGDILLVPVEKIPHTRQRVRDGGRAGVVAEGEATGHAHRIEGPARVVAATPHTSVPGELYVVVDGAEATLVHEEHDPIGLAKGVYQVVRQREYVPAPRDGRPDWRQVAD
jgi:hypothetical protein